jgi:hypothetical protein
LIYEIAKVVEEDISDEKEFAVWEETDFGYETTVKIPGIDSVNAALRDGGILITGKNTVFKGMAVEEEHTVNALIAIPSEIRGKIVKIQKKVEHGVLLLRIVMDKPQIPVEDI